MGAVRTHRRPGCGRRRWPRGQTRTRAATALQDPHPEATPGSTGEAAPGPLGVVSDGSWKGSSGTKKLGYKGGLGAGAARFRDTCTTSGASPRPRPQPDATPPVARGPAGSPASGCRAALARVDPSRWWTRVISAALRSSNRQGAGEAAERPLWSATAARLLRGVVPTCAGAAVSGLFPWQRLPAVSPATRGRPPRPQQPAAMDALSGAGPRRARGRLGAPSSGARAPAAPWARFSAWLECVCVVTFDLELGQALEVSGAP